jgi:hypothetical protein
VVTAGHPATFTWTQLDPNTNGTDTYVETYTLNQATVTPVPASYTGPFEPGDDFLLLNMTVRNDGAYTASPVPAFSVWVGDGSTPPGDSGPITLTQVPDNAGSPAPVEASPLGYHSTLLPGASATGDVTFIVPSTPGFIEETANPGGGNGQEDGYTVDQLGTFEQVLVELKWS